MHGKQDNFVLPHHTQAIYEKYAGDKEIELFEGSHNGRRPQELLNKIQSFFYRTLQIDQI